MGRMSTPPAADGVRAAAAESAVMREETPDPATGLIPAIHPPRYVYLPSFQWRMHAMRNEIRIGRLVHRSYESVSLVVPKLAAYRWAASLDVKPPRVFGVFDQVDEIAWDALPDRAVVKTDRGAASRGVYPLLRRGDGWWLELHSGQTKTERAIVAELAAHTSSKRISRRVFVEDLVDDGHGDRAPYDWKLYCFYGRVGLIMQRDTRNSRLGKDFTFRYFDRDWTDLGQANTGSTIDRELPPPWHPGDLVACAERISAAVPRPFLRVDLYDVPGRVVFGEITINPGGDHYLRPDVDRALGELWDDAAARLTRDLTRAGRLPLAGDVGEPGQPGPAGPDLP